jgi:PhzF family phenazine biosynthesis protein
MPRPISVVDAFASKPFEGNPAAVCLLEAPAGESWMQSVAAEMNLSETAFLVARGGMEWDLRWFTPTLEVDLCGHATLASAHALWESGQADRSSAIRFYTRSGGLECRWTQGRIQMDFPARPAKPAPLPDGLEAALGARPVGWGRSCDDYLVELADAGLVRALSPDLSSLARMESRGVIVTARSDRPEFDFISRFFAPAAGVPEDPVTGSAHCTLAPYWSERLGRNTLTGFQASRRGGVVGVDVAGDRVRLSGSAVTVWRGELL